eukprot:gene10969-22925_t
MEGTLGIVSIFGLLLSFLPVILQWELLDKEKVLKSTLSLDFKFSLVAAIALSIPISVDFLLDISSTKRGKRPGNLSRFISYLPLGVLIFSLIVPDAIIFFIAIPLELPGLVICIFQARNVACAYANQSHLCDVGSIFNTNGFRSGLYFALTTYVESVFTLIITISHGRINHAAILHAQQ